MMVVFRLGKREKKGKIRKQWKTKEMVKTRFDAHQYAYSIPYGNR